MLYAAKRKLVQFDPKSKDLQPMRHVLSRKSTRDPITAIKKQPLNPYVDDVRNCIRLVDSGEDGSALLNTIRSEANRNKEEYAREANRKKKAMATNIKKSSLLQPILDEMQKEKVSNLSWIYLRDYFNQIFSKYRGECDTFLKTIGNVVEKWLQAKRLQKISPKDYFGEFLESHEFFSNIISAPDAKNVKWRNYVEGQSSFSGLTEKYIRNLHRFIENNGGLSYSFILNNAIYSFGDVLRKFICHHSSMVFRAGTPLPVAFLYIKESHSLSVGFLHIKESNSVSVALLYIKEYDFYQ